MANFYDAVGVIGGGSWGTALAHLLGKSGNPVLFWMRDTQVLEEINKHHTSVRYAEDVVLSANITATNDLQQVVQRCEILIMAVPSSGFREVAYKIGNYIKGDQIILSGCKGLEATTHARMTEILGEETCVRKIGVLSGPNLGAEVLHEHPSATVLASRYHEVIEKSRKLFNAPFFKVYASDDILGVELGGVLKNVIAIAAGIVDGMHWGANSKAFLITRGLAEMGRIGSKLGANPVTFTGLSGIGDMVVTCSSPLSRNYRVGYLLTQGKPLPQILQEIKSCAEGINTCKVLHDIAQEEKVTIPIMEGIYQIVHHHRAIQEVLTELMARQFKFEIDTTLFER